MMLRVIPTCSKYSTPALRRVHLSVSASNRSFCNVASFNLTTTCASLAPAVSNCNAHLSKTPFARGQHEQRRWNSSSDDKETVEIKSTNEPATPPPPPTTTTTEKEEEVLYEGPFASLSLRLKRVSITTAAVSLFGVPVLVALKTGGDIPAVGSLAVGGTAVLAATGSTIALSYCFSPYVHTLTRIQNDDDDEETSNLVKATTRNILAMQVETTFDPTKDVSLPSSGTMRPFCNFVVKGSMPLYVHPELIHDEILRVQLLGEDSIKKDELSDNDDKKKMRKDDDDEFL